MPIGRHARLPGYVDDIDRGGIQKDDLFKRIFAPDQAEERRMGKQKTGLGCYDTADP